MRPKGPVPESLEWGANVMGARGSPVGAGGGDRVRGSPSALRPLPQHLASGETCIHLSFPTCAS